MAGSAGRLVFDVTDTGAGVQVFQPFEVTDGRDALAALPVVRDGDNAVTLQIGNLSSEGAIAFTIDVDDTKKQREITVTDSELDGATVTLEAGGTRTQAAFGARPSTSVATPAC